ncbi:hypothetical protein TRFO_21031 [Tritrichomonas foetus]|uniref:Ras-GAP domain-containing protein n=1 Tax=Tritrichomonas foetus TaxID=1144522 RepID=A0A1J4KJE2_9EUKA|nr:hypothetical protein TRFO_21031 [Tritrichomonas foetus]|eukprot:OHT09940.1 hypothetical protein TRFO_21031 [Tritrichomonas foetus]
MIIFEFSKLLLPFENGKINNSKLNSNAVSKVSNSNMPKNSIINENSNSNLTPSLNTNLASNLNSCHSNLTSPATNPMSTNSSDNIKESVIMFAVVTDKANYYWVVLTKNYSINLYKIIQGSPLFKTVDFNNYAANGKKIIIDGIQYDYTRKNTGELIKIGLSRPNDNICFLRSFKGIKRYSKFIPDIVKNHFISLLSSPDFTLTTSIVEVLFNEHDKNIIPDIIGCLEGTGTFSPFLRYIFSDSVMNTDRADFLFKNSSVCTYLASNIFYMKGNLLLKPIIEQIKCNKDSPIGAIASIIAQSSNLPLSLRFVLQNVFKSSRRKFPYNLTPLHVLSDFFMFRFIFPAMVTDQGLADKSLTDIGKSIGNAFMFKRDDPSVNDEGLLKSIAAFLLDITKIDSQAVDIQKINFENIVFFLDSYNDKLIKNFTHKKEKRIHPFTWSMVEIIENCFVGCNENFAAEINASQLFA